MPTDTTSYTVTQTGEYQITLAGGQGGDAVANGANQGFEAGGGGAEIVVDVELTAGTTLNFQSGGEGGDGEYLVSGAGGGGASTVYDTATGAYIAIAGGGGGAGDYFPGSPGVTTQGPLSPTPDGVTNGQTGSGPTDSVVSNGGLGGGGDGDIGGGGGGGAGAGYGGPDNLVGEVNGALVPLGSGGGGGGSEVGAGGTVVSEISGANDGAGFVTIQEVACFGRGTPILTTRGEVCVERLKVGDQVLTLSGRSSPVRWIGHRTIDCSRHPRPLQAHPICIKAHAFADDAPHTDLWVSPGHSVFVDGVLIPACFLVNGKSVVQLPVAEVEYWHVELDEHAVLTAAGLACESYLDTGNRSAFANGGDVTEAFPTFEPKSWTDTCAPLVFEGPKLERAKARLLARLHASGHEVIFDADVHMLIDGRRIAPIPLGDDRFAFAPPADACDIRLASRTFIPSHTVASNSDPRRLGLCIGRMEVNGLKVALEDPRLDPEAWHQLEVDAQGSRHRWTRGPVSFPPGTRLLVIELVGHGYYWTDRVDDQEPLEDSLRKAA